MIEQIRGSGSPAGSGRTSLADPAGPPGRGSGEMLAMVLTDDRETRLERRPVPAPRTRPWQRTRMRGTRNWRRGGAPRSAPWKSRTTVSCSPRWAAGSSRRRSRRPSGSWPPPRRTRPRTCRRPPGPRLTRRRRPLRRKPAGSTAWRAGRVASPNGTPPRRRRWNRRWPSTRGGRSRRRPGGSWAARPTRSWPAAVTSRRGRTAGRTCSAGGGSLRPTWPRSTRRWPPNGSRPRRRAGRGPGPAA